MRRLVVECKRCGMVIGTFRATSAPVHATSAAASAAEHHDLEQNHSVDGADVRDATPLEAMLLCRIEQLEDAIGIPGRAG